MFCCASQLYKTCEMGFSGSLLITSYSQPLMIIALCIDENSFVVAFLMVERRRTLFDSYRYVKKLRPHVNIAKHFLFEVWRGAFARQHTLK